MVMKFNFEKPQNYAANEVVRKRVEGELGALLNHVRQRKQSLNTMWQALYRVWFMQHDQQGYVGRSNLYLPAGRKGVETLAANLVAAAFPVDEPFSVTARAEAWEEQAPKVKGALAWAVQQAQVRAELEAYFRSLLITGNAVVKFGWKKRQLTQRKRGTNAEKFRDSSLFVVEPGFVDQTTAVLDSPTFDLVDPANFYVWPETAPSIYEAELVFEDMQLPWRTLMARARDGEFLTEQVLKLRRGETGTERQSNEQSRLEPQGMSAVENTMSAPVLVDVTEVYLNMDPTAASWDTEDPDKVVPCLVTLSTKSNTVLRVIENPMHHKLPPYGVGRIGKTQGRFWGSGVVEGIRDLQVLLNDQTNQAVDCATYHLNPLILANPNLLVGDAPELEPGAMFWANDINAAVKFDRPPGDLIQTGSVLMAQTANWIQDYIGAPPILSGGAAPGRAFRSATGVGTAQRNAVVPLQEIVRGVEVETFEPMLQQYYFLMQQFGSDAFLAKVGDKLQRLRPEELLGDYMFKWMASSQAQNLQVRGGQIQQLLTVLAAPPMQQLLQANGFKVNPKPLIRKLYEEVFGFRDMDDVIIEQSMAAVGMQPMRPLQPMQPQVSSMSGIRSPEGEFENELEGNPETEDPNGEFGANRMDANSIAAALGGLGTGGAIG